MHVTIVSAILALAIGSSAAKNPQANAHKYTATGAAAVAKAAATAKTSSPTSNVQGKAFDRFAVIWLENTDYDIAAADPNLHYLASKGITLTQNYAVTHPSEPNYVSSHGGDYFGMDNDNFNQVPRNISSIVDLLEEKGISWGEYQEDMPFSGFEGYAWVNQQNGANDYVRKHNPAVIYDSTATSLRRLSQIKNLTMFQKDLNHNQLPQWMFITPNMTSDGHDSSVTVAGKWTRNFVEPLLNNKKFMQNTLLLITFDENELYTKQNKVFGILIGDSIPKRLVGTTDNTYYNHYSQLATVEANWDLNTLGRFDVGANVYKVVADRTGDKLRKWKTPKFSDMFFNYSYPGPFNSVKNHIPFAAPNINAVHAGRAVSPAIVKTWKGHAKDTIYGTNVEIPDGYHPPKY